MPNKIDVVGRVFARATVVSDGPKAPNGRRTVICRCSCGSEFSCDPRDLMKGHTKSCGCLQREAVRGTAISMTTHAMTGSPEYISWVHMKGRCQNQKNRKYSQYGGRGIRVCQSWDENFEAFLRDMGEKPFAGASIDRINVDGDYEPGNCRWADAKMQAQNKRSHRMVEYGGRSIPLSEACELSGVNYRSALARLNAGKHWRPLPAPPAAGGKDGE